MWRLRMLSRSISICKLSPTQSLWFSDRVLAPRIYEFSIYCISSGKKYVSRKSVNCTEDSESRKWSLTIQHRLSAFLSFFLSVLSAVLSLSLSRARARAHTHTHTHTHFLSHSLILLILSPIPRLYSWVVLHFRLRDKLSYNCTVTNKNRTVNNENKRKLRYFGMWYNKSWDLRC